MSNKIFAFLAVFCLLNVSFAYRLPRSLAKVGNALGSSEKSSEEFTETDLAELRVELEKQLPKEEAKRIGDIFAKFTEGQTEETEAQGVLELLTLMIQGVLAESKNPGIAPIVVVVSSDTMNSLAGTGLSGNKA